VIKNFRIKSLFLILMIGIFFGTIGFLPVLAQVATPEPAAPRAAGSFNDVWVSTNNGTHQITQYTSAGLVISTSITVDSGGGSSVTEYNRDLVMGGNGLIHVYNGTFSPYLSTYHPITPTWTHKTYSEWSTVNNVSYGGIARHQNFIFVTDMNTAEATAKGIVRFDMDADTAVRFATSVEFIDLTIGMDRLLYALENDEDTVYVYNPVTNGFIKTINLAAGVRGIGVTAAGHIFGASWDDNIYHFDQNGTQLNSIDSGVSDLVDLDITCDGHIVVGSRFGDVIFTDTSLGSVTSFDTGLGQAFVTFSNPRNYCYFFPIFNHPAE
jgi:hypothetical protein